MYLYQILKNNLKNIYWVIGVLIVNTKLNINANYVMKNKEKNCESFLANA